MTRKTHIPLQLESREVSCHCVVLASAPASRDGRGTTRLACEMMSAVRVTLCFSRATRCPPLHLREWYSPSGHHGGAASSWGKPREQGTLPTKRPKSRWARIPSLKGGNHHGPRLRNNPSHLADAMKSGANPLRPSLRLAPPSRLPATVDETNGA